MRWHRLMMLPMLLGVLSIGAIAPPPPPKLAESAETPTMRFMAIDVLIDSDDARLGAWQIEYQAVIGADAKVMLVGVEGGEHPAYAKAPHYDPAALSGGRVIIASYTTADDAPLGLTRVARLHLSVTGAGAPEHSLRLIAAGDSEGVRIEPKVRTSESTPKSNTKNDTNTEYEGPQP